MENEIIWWNGRIVNWKDAQVHVTSETASRGLNVFEGIRVYWRSSNETYRIVAEEEHLNRLTQSAQLLLFPVLDFKSLFIRGILDLLKDISNPTDLYLRPTIYVEEGAYEIEPFKIILGEYISWRPEPSIKFRTLKCIVSSWKHLPSDCLPQSAKIGAVYTIFRMARLEAAASGYDEAILINSKGQITETGGGSVFIVRGGRIITPPLAVGILPSITRQIVLNYLCPTLKIKSEERYIGIDDLYSADEAFVSGTLCEISRIILIDKKVIADSGPIVFELQSLYHKLCSGNVNNSKLIKIVHRNKL